MNNKIRKAFKCFKKGFTLVELIVVIAIIAILAAVSVAGYFGFTNNAKESNDKTLVKQLDTLVKTASDENLVSAVELRKHFAENGITEVKVQNSKNMIVYDLNQKSVQLVKSGSGNYQEPIKTRRGIDGTVLADVFTFNGEALEINSNPSSPEEIFSGKMILSTSGNEMSNFVSSLRNGRLNISYLNEMYESSSYLAQSVAALVSKSVFIDSVGDTSYYNLVFNANYSQSEKTDFSNVKYAVFAEDATTIKATTFEKATSLQKIIIPSSITTIDETAFDAFVNNDSISNLTVAFMNENVAYIDAIKSNLVNKGATITNPVTVSTAIREDTDVFISGIKRYVNINSMDELKSALNKVELGDCLRITSDFTITESVNIPKNVTLLVSCRQDDVGYDTTGYNPNGTNVKTGKPEGEHISAYSTLTVASEATLSINGQVLVNAVSGQPMAANYDQDVNGQYGLINLEGTISVNEGGLLDCCGYIKGNGKVIAHNNSEVRDLYVVRNWRGGSQAFNVYSSTYPMNEYDMHNIEATLELESGSSLVGTVKMFASGSFFYTRFPQVNNENGLIRLSGGSKIVKTYDPTISEGYKYGKETYTITGGATFSGSSLPIVGIEMTTRDFVYPIDGDINFKLKNGEYKFDKALSGEEGIKGYKFMPGSQMVVSSDASLTIPSGVEVVFYDKFIDDDNHADTEYPSRESAMLTLDDGSRLTSNGSFGGLINIKNVSSNNTTAVLNGATTVRTTEAKGYCNGTKVLTFNTNYYSDTHVYLDGEIEGKYSFSNWVDNQTAITTFNALEVLNKTSDQIITPELEAQASMAVTYYNRLINSNLDSNTINTLVSDYGEKISSFELKLFPLISVDGKTFTLFTEALNAIKDGSVITLLGDVELHEAINFNKKNLTLDLNGYSITTNNKIEIISESSIVFKNGTFLFPDLDTTCSSGAIQNEGTISFINCTLNSETGNNKSYPIIGNGGLIELIDSCSFVSKAKIIGKPLYPYGNIAEINKITDSTFNSIERCLDFEDDSGLTLVIGLISNCMFTSSNDTAIFLEGNSEFVIKKMENCTVVSNSTAPEFYKYRSAIVLKGNAEIQYFSGTIIANSNVGVINSSSKKSMFFSNNIYLKNNDSSFRDKILVSGDQAVWSIDIFKFEEGYILSNTPIVTGPQAGFYTTTLGYSVTFVDTEYDPNTGSPISNGNGTYHGKQLENSYYILSDVASNYNGSISDKDSNLAHYKFVGWMDINGNKITDVSNVKQNLVVYTKYELTEQTGSFIVDIDSDGFGKIFSSLGKAINECQESVTMLSNYSTSGVIIPDNKSITLNLNGKVLTFDGSTSYGFKLNKKSTLSITGSSGELVMNGTGTQYLIDNSLGGDINLGTQSYYDQFSSFNLTLGNNVGSESYILYSLGGSISVGEVTFNGPANDIYLGNNTSISLGYEDANYGNSIVIYQDLTIDATNGSSIEILSMEVLLTTVDKQFINIVDGSSINLTVNINYYSWSLCRPAIYLPSTVIDEKLSNYIYNGCTSYKLVKGVDANGNDIVDENGYVKYYIEKV